MLFTLEAVFARNGDALILHYGPPANPKWILIDGGPTGVFDKYVGPRFQELRDEWDIEEDQSFPLELVLVSHPDDDHINGVLRLFEILENADGKNPLPFKVKRLWLNSFEDIVGNQGGEIVAALRADLDQSDAVATSVAPCEAAAVLASVDQARCLRKTAMKLGIINVNTPFGKLVMREDDEPTSVGLGHDLEFRVLGPSAKRIDQYRERWKKDLKKILDKEKKAAETAAMTEGSPFNLASIVVLAEAPEGTMLLTGDGRGDDIIEGLEGLDLIKEDGSPFHVNLFKLPHHGSSENVSQEFFERVTADHYLISGNGGHGNPELETLKMLAAARNNEPYTIHFTVREDAHETDTSKNRRKIMKKISDWVKHDRPANCKVVFRGEDTDSHSVLIDLGDPLC